MPTIKQIISDAAKEAAILATGQVLESDQEEIALSQLNFMLRDWNNAGTDLGLSLPLGLNDTYFGDDDDLGAIHWNLSVKIATRFRRPIPQFLAIDANDSLRSLRVKYFDVPEAELECTFKVNLANDHELNF